MKTRGRLHLQNGTFSQLYIISMLKRNLLLPGLLLLACFAANAQTEEKDSAIAGSLIRAGKYEEAIPLLTKLISNYGEREKYLSDRGLAFMSLEKTEQASTDFKKALLLNAGCTRCLGNLGIMELENKNFTTAIGYFEKFIQLKPADAMGYVKRGEARFQLQQYDDAITDFNKGLTIDINSPYILLYRSMSLQAKGDYKAAMDDINKSIQVKPDVEFAYFIRGKILIQLGDYAAAVKDIFASLQKNPNVPEYNTYAGIALYYLGDHNKAWQAFSAAVKLDSTDFVPFQYRSYMLYNAANFTQGCAEKQRALSLAFAAKNETAINQLGQEMDEYCDLSKPGAHYHSGAILFGQGDFEKARKAYQNGLVRFHDNPLLLEGMGNTALASGQFNEALDFYNSCMANISGLDLTLLAGGNNPEGKTAARDFFLSQLYNSISFAHISLMHIDTAIHWLSKSISTLRSNPAINGRNITLSEFLVKRASMYGLLQNETAAAADISEALQINPKSADAYIEMARKLITKNTTERNIANENIKTVYQPNAPGNNTSISIPTIPLKNWNKSEIEQAEKYCTKAIEFNPSAREAYMMRAQVKIILKKNDYCTDIEMARQLGIADAAKRLNASCK